MFEREDASCSLKLVQLSLVAIVPAALVGSSGRVPSMICAFFLASLILAISLTS